jgi:hypothetical protein
MGSNTHVENTHPHTDIEVVNSNENSAQGTISIFNNRVGGNDLEDFTNMDEEDFSDVDQDESLNSKKSGSQRKPKTTLRKDPTHNKNRYKFSKIEDEILISKFLDKIKDQPADSLKILHAVKE